MLIFRLSLFLLSGSFLSFPSIRLFLSSSSLLPLFFLDESGRQTSIGSAQQAKMSQPTALRFSAFTHLLFCGLRFARDSQIYVAISRPHQLVEHVSNSVEAVSAHQRVPVDPHPFVVISVHSLTSCVSQVVLRGITIRGSEAEDRDQDEKEKERQRMRD